jgi:hypothetical protein
MWARVARNGTLTSLIGAAESPSLPGRSRTRKPVRSSDGCSSWRDTEPLPALRQAEPDADCRTT